MKNAVSEDIRLEEAKKQHFFYSCKPVNPSFSLAKYFEPGRPGLEDIFTFAGNPGDIGLLLPATWLMTAAAESLYPPYPSSLSVSKKC
jgi:hypothetical protein